MDSDEMKCHHTKQKKGLSLHPSQKGILTLALTFGWTMTGEETNGVLEEERQGKMVCPPQDKSTFEGLEEIAKLVNAKGCFFHRGTCHPKEEAIQEFLDGCEEEDFPFGEFPSAQFLVAPPVEEESDCDDSDCQDEDCDEGDGSAEMDENHRPKHEEEKKDDGEDTNEKDSTNQPTNQGKEIAEKESANPEEKQVHTLASMDEILEGCKHLVEELPEAFRKDIRQDAEALATISTRLCPEAPWLTMRLEVVQEHMCSRWHQDNYISRSLITYVGPGTCAAEDAHVKWDEFPKTAEDPTNESVVPREGITQMPTNAVLLIKGDSWPGIRGKGLTHKSPTDHGDGPPPKRLLLKVDLHNVRPLLADDDDPFLADDSEGEDQDSEDGEGYESEGDERETVDQEEEEKEEANNKRERESEEDGNSFTKLAKVDTSGSGDPS